MSGSCSLAATMSRAGLVFVLLIVSGNQLLSISLLVIPSAARDLPITRLCASDQNMGIQGLIVCCERSFDSRCASLRMTIRKPAAKSGSAHFQLFSQDEVQQDKQYECGYDQHYRVEGEDPER